MHTRMPTSGRNCSHNRKIHDDPAWAHRRLLLRAGNERSPEALARLKTVFDTDDPTDEISAAWGIKELLRP